MSGVTVHTWEPNSNSGKPLFALAEKGVDFDHAYVDIVKFEQHMPDYLALNPAGTVPTMRRLSSGQSITCGPMTYCSMRPTIHTGSLMGMTRCRPESRKVCAARS